MHVARTHDETAGIRSSYRLGRHWAAGDQAVQHPGRLADCALCLTAPDPSPEVSPLY